MLLKAQHAQYILGLFLIYSNTAMFSKDLTWKIIRFDHLENLLVCNISLSLMMPDKVNTTTLNIILPKYEFLKRPFYKSIVKDSMDVFLTF